ncbi:MAG: pilin [Patescibacteria group bacterium]|nr:pilin [Patescibacteria group bacterium]MDD5164116.1 pilin [Patescibacteria group bacterium]MDD5534226.1 pilin [Patescibacteria group bacterium]
MKKIIFIIFIAIFLISIGSFANAQKYERIIGTKNITENGVLKTQNIISSCTCGVEDEGKKCDCFCQGTNNVTNCHVGGLINQPICACCGDCTVNDFERLYLNLANIILKYLGVIALVLFIFGGISWMTSAGSEEKVKKGKAIIMGAVVGMVIVLSAYVIVQALMQALHTESYLSQEKCQVDQVDDGSCIEAGSRYNDYKDNKVEGFKCSAGKCSGTTTICCKETK